MKDKPDHPPGGIWTATGADLDHAVASLGVGRLISESDDALRKRAMSPNPFAVAPIAHAHESAPRPHIMDAAGADLDRAVAALTTLDPCPPRSPGEDDKAFRNRALSVAADPTLRFYAHAHEGASGGGNSGNRMVPVRITEFAVDAKFPKPVRWAYFNRDTGEARRQHHESDATARNISIWSWVISEARKLSCPDPDGRRSDEGIRVFMSDGSVRDIISTEAGYEPKRDFEASHRADDADTIAALRAEVARLQKAGGDFYRQAINAQSENADLRARLDGAERGREAFKAEASRLDAVADHMLATVESVVAERNALEAENRTLREALDLAQREDSAVDVDGSQTYAAIADLSTMLPGSPAAERAARKAAGRETATDFSFDRVAQRLRGKTSRQVITDDPFAPEAAADPAPPPSDVFTRWALAVLPPLDDKPADPMSNVLARAMRSGND